MTRPRPSIFVAGALANKPGNGGAAWTRLSWLLGFRDLGCDVFFVEQIEAGACVDAESKPADPRHSVNLRYFRAVTEAFGLEGASALVLDEPAILHGPSLDTLRRRAARADLLVNISGNLTVGCLKTEFRRSAYLDLDPGYTQMWNAQGRLSGLRAHDLHFTVGENIGQGAACPADGIRWRPVRQPVLLDYWPDCSPPANGAFTTVASWRGPYGRVQHGGTTFGVKAHEFRKYVDLPSRTPHRFEIALEIHEDDGPDRQNLLEHGWIVRDPLEVAGDPWAFRRFVQQSGAEFSVAQGIYVETASGWFSDRTTRYLASGRPALVQDTGFSRNYPVGEGLLAFGSVDEALSGIDAIHRDYRRHARAARALAVDHFDARKVLAQFAAAAEVDI